MKLTYQNRALLLSIIVFFLLTLPFTLFITYLKKKAINEVFEKCKSSAESLAKSIILSGGNITKSYFPLHFDNPEVYRAMEKAIEGKEEEARFELYISLWKVFNTLRERIKLRDVQFLLPNGRVLLRLRAPHMYGDYPSQVNLLIKRALEEGTYQEGFGTDGMLSGYVYIYPLRDTKGKKLGAVAFYLSLESVRNFLKELNPNTPYMFLLKEDILQRIFPEYREYYLRVEGLKGWLIEDPYRDVLAPVGRFSKKEESLLRALVADKDFLNSLYTKGNHIMYFNHQGAHYKVIVIKIEEGGEEVAALIKMPSGVDIYNLSRSYSAYILVFYLVSLVLSVYTFFYIKGLYRLKLSHQQLENVLSLTNAGLLVLDREGKVVMLNQTACDILEYQREEIIGKIFHDLVHHHTGPIEQCPIYRAVSKGNTYWGEDAFMKKSGELVEVEVDIKPIQLDSFLEGAVMSFYDISERKRKEKGLYDMAVHDRLTGLYNRWYAEDFFEKELAFMNRERTSFCLLILDIDNFKKINDTYGHNVGDEVIKSLAQIIRTHVRAYDLVVRWGGEEFIVFLPNTDIREALKVAERIRTSVESFRQGTLPNFTVSIGVASYREGDSLDSLIERADRALYVAKKEGKNRVEVG